MQLILLILGIVGVVLPEYFSAQNTLGWIFIIVSAVLFLIQLFWIVFVSRKITKRREDFNQSRFR